MQPVKPLEDTLLKHQILSANNGWKTGMVLAI